MSRTWWNSSWGWSVHLYAAQSTERPVNYLTLPSEEHFPPGGSVHLHYLSSVSNPTPCLTSSLIILEPEGHLLGFWFGSLTLLWMETKKRRHTRLQRVRHYYHQTAADVHNKEEKKWGNLRLRPAARLTFTDLFMDLFFSRGSHINKMTFSFSSTFVLRKKYQLKFQTVNKENQWTPAEQHDTDEKRNKSNCLSREHISV